MQIPDALFPALVGALAAVLTSVLASLLGYRTLRAEYTSRHRLELIGKQIAACEALWATLGLAAQAQGDRRVIVHQDGKSYVSPAVARELYLELTRVFNSSSGLYYSKDLRTALFGLRDFIETDLMEGGAGGQPLREISNNKARKFDQAVTWLRVAIRKEIGVEDLKAGVEGPIKEK